VKRTPVRGVKENLKPSADERSEDRFGRRKPVGGLMACLLKNEPASYCLWREVKCF
jgi:hypothetical protein